MNEFKNYFPDNAKLVFKWELFDIYQRDQIMFDWSIKKFERLKKNDSVDIVAISDDWKIYILKEEQPWREWFYWLVWWSCEDWEVPLETAKRELLEETWLISENWDFFNSYKKSSKIEQKSHIFIARNCKKIQEQNLDLDWEKIVVTKMSRKEFVNIVSDPKFRVSEFALEVLRYIFLWKEKKLKTMIYWK